MTKIDKLRDGIKLALINHEELKRKSEVMCDHLRRVDEFLEKLKSKQCNSDELQNLTTADLLDKNKFDKLCLNIEHSTSTPSLEVEPTKSEQVVVSEEIRINNELGNIGNKIEELIKNRKGKTELTDDNKTFDKTLFDIIISDIRRFIQNSKNNLNKANEKAQEVNSKLINLFNDEYIKKHFLKPTYIFKTNPIILICEDNCTRKVATLFNGVDGEVQNKMAGDKSFILPKELTMKFAPELQKSSY
jgi:hypothetical protein